jgi:hypothetical protein
LSQKLIIFATKSKHIEAMQSIEDNILAKVQKAGRWRMYFPSDFATFGESKAVAKALERMAKSGQLLRLAQGIYYHPKIDSKLGLGVLYPSLEAIAQGIAERDKAKIVPTGTYALNRLGLSTQIPTNIVYLTDGTPRNIKVGNGRGIQFRRTAPKNLAFKSELAMLVTFALKELKQENVMPEHLDKIKNLLQNESKERIMSDAVLMPAWVRSIIMKSYE